MGDRRRDRGAVGGDLDEFAQLWHLAREAEVLDTGQAPVRPVPAETTGTAASAPRTLPHDLLCAYAAELIASRDAESARAAVDRLIDHYVHAAHAPTRRMHPLRDPNRLTLSAPLPGVAVERFPDVDAAVAWLDIQYPVLVAILHQSEGRPRDGSRRGEKIRIASLRSHHGGETTALTGCL